MKRLLYIAFITQLLFASSGLSQPPQMTVEDYIDTYKDFAIEEMRKHGIPASITLAQGILESGSGNSELARLANNHFGIKCHKEWTGKTFHQDDDEKDECFRKYKSALESYQDHSDFLASRDRYNFLFDLDIKDYKGWAYGLKEAGYATNPRYPEMLVRIIEENGLAKYDTPKGQRHAPKAKPEGSTVSGQRSADQTQNSELKTQNPEIFGRGGNDRVIFLNNGVKFILAREGDDYYRIAKEFKIYAWQVREYNELNKKDKLVAGQRIYLERKMAKAEVEWHTASQGETMQSISQKYGIRLKALKKLNRILKEEELKEGEMVRLR